MLKYPYFWFYLVVCLALTNCQSPKPIEQQPTPTNPPSWEVKTLPTIKNKGEFQELLANQKGKVTLVNLWATWCKPCVNEMPILEKIHKKYQDKGVKIIALSLDKMEKADSLVPPYWENNGFSMDYYVLEPKDPSTIINKVDPLWLGVLPTSFILDPTGEKVETISGTLDYKEFEQKILAVLNAHN